MSIFSDGSEKGNDQKITCARARIRICFCDKIMEYTNIEYISASVSGIIICMFRIWNIIRFVGSDWKRLSNPIIIVYVKYCTVQCSMLLIEYWVIRFYGHPLEHEAHNKYYCIERKRIERDEKKFMTTGYWLLVFPFFAGM